MSNVIAWLITIVCMDLWYDFSPKEVFFLIILIMIRFDIYDIKTKIDDEDK